MKTGLSAMLESFVSICGWILFLIIYSTCGLFMSVLHGFFSGSITNFNLISYNPLIYCLLSLIAPIYVVIMLSFWHFHTLDRPNLPTWASKAGFYAMLIYSILPIAFNALSLCMRMAGLETIADITFFLRYWTLVAAPIIGLYFYVRKIINHKNINIAPPANPIDHKKSPVETNENQEQLPVLRLAENL